MVEVITDNTNYLAQNSLSNLDRWDTTERDLLGYFGQYGSISNVTIKYNPQTGNPRGFGFVTFASDASIDAALDNCPHSLKNKLIELRKARTSPICKKIFVGGLYPSISEQDIRKYFSQFGNIEGIELPFDRVRNRRREFCFVIFEDEESADKACLDSKQTVNQCEVDIKKAQPNYLLRDRRNYQNSSHSNQNNSSNGLSYNGDSYNRNWRSDNRNSSNNYRQQVHTSRSSRSSSGFNNNYVSNVDSNPFYRSQSYLHKNNYE